jgi:3-phenylpropionate/trans-cinnamate dioxygenase ferredoxin reductase component
VSPLAPTDHVVVVGAGLAGWRLVEALRREGFGGALSLVGAEPHAPYDRPPLSKQVLVGKWPVEHTLLANDELVRRSGAALHLGARAVALDVSASSVELEDGRRLTGTHVAVATGARARRLGYRAEDRIHVVRTLDDVATLNADLSSLGVGGVVAVIGGGFIGAEVATAMRTRGYRPVVLEVAERPLLGVLGPLVSRWLADLPAAAGVELRTGQRVSDVVEHGDGLRVLVENGSDVDAGVVVVGAGVVPNDDWLATSGLMIENGVVVDEHLLASERVAALGDVARFEWRGAAGTERVRIEHWQVANDHAAILARHWMSGAPADAPMVPYFWSDQYDKKIQLLGHPHPDDDVERVSVDADRGRWLALYSRDGVVTGAITLSHPRALMLCKPLVERPTSLETALERAPWSD